jgi:hypothetical protein
MAITPKETKYDRRYYLKHREERIAQAREYRSKHPEKMKEYDRRYKQKHREELRPYHDKWLREYRTGDSEKAKACRERKNAHQRAYRSGDSEEAKAFREREKVRKRKYFLEKHDHVETLRKNKIAWFYDLKRTMKCAVCGQSFPDCPDIIDFHHIKGKESGKDRIGSMVTGKAPKARILAEIEKCTPLCSNCHRKVHYLIKQRRKGSSSERP